MYCSPYHRQRAYQDRRASRLIPLRLLEHDIDSIKTKDGFRRAVVARDGAARGGGVLPPCPNVGNNQ
jgi:hypothetical protein